MKRNEIRNSEANSSDFSKDIDECFSFAGIINCPFEKSNSIISVLFRVKFPLRMFMNNLSSLAISKNY